MNESIEKIKKSFDDISSELDKLISTDISFLDAKTIRLIIKLYNLFK